MGSVCCFLELATGVGFSAFSSATMDYDQGATVGFDSVVSNVGGFYNADTGIFTCPTDGLYSFSVSAESDFDYYATLDIIRNGNVLLSMHAVYYDHDQSSITAITECLVFDSVYIQCGEDNSQVKGGRRSSFSGVLITPYA